MRIKYRLIKFIEDSSGNMIVEFALVFPFLIMLLIGFIVWSLFMWEFHTFHYSLEAGARCGILSPPPLGSTALCGTSSSHALSNSYAVTNISQSDFKTSSIANGLCVSVSIANKFKIVVDIPSSFNVEVCRPTQ